MLKERYVYHAAGMRGLSLSQGLDRVVKRERFAAPDGNGVQALSDEVYYLQNRRGDVTELLGPDGEVKERVRYTVYGEAEAIDPGFDALDIDGNGSVDPDDLAQFIAWFFAENPTESGAFQRDYNHDGQFTPDDLADFMGAFFAWDQNAAPAQARPTLAMDHGALSRPGIENRLGYCGYVWDRWLQVYHVRHRVYEPYHGRWYQPDPIGFAGGRNWFEYCGGQPSTTSDPMGKFGPMGAAIGAGIGAVLGFAISVGVDLYNGDPIDWKRAGASAAGGAVGGAILGFFGPMGLGGTMMMGALAGAADGVVTQIIDNLADGRPWYDGVGQAGLVGAGGGFLGGAIGKGVGKLIGVVARSPLGQRVINAVVTMVEESFGDSRIGKAIARGLKGLAGGGGPVGSTTAELQAEAEAAAARAREIRDLLPTPQARDYRTVAVLTTESGERIVGGGVRDLDPIQRRAVAASGEYAAKLTGAHAEPTVLSSACRAELVPRAMGTSRKICPECRVLIEAAGGQITSPTTVIWLPRNGS